MKVANSLFDAQQMAGAIAIKSTGDGKWSVYFEDDIPPVQTELTGPPVPSKVTRRQFRQGLTRLGVRAAVDAWRAALDTSTQVGQDVADWYDDSNEFERGNPILNAMAAQFGLSSDQVDAAFVMMAGL